MPTCAITGCKSGNGHESDKVQAFSFPSESRLKNEWISSISRKNYVVTKNTRVCEKHFKHSDFVPQSENKDSRGRNKLKRKLQPFAVPSIDLEPSKISKLEILAAVKNDHPYFTEQITEDEARAIAQENLPEQIEILPLEVEISSRNVEEMLVERDEIIEDQKAIIKNLQKELNKSNLVIEKVKAVLLSLLLNKPPSQK